MEQLPFCTEGRLFHRHGGLVREQNHTIRMRKGRYRCPHCETMLSACTPNSPYALPLWHQDVDYYMDLVGMHGLPEEDRPRHCPECRQRVHMPHRHSHFERMVFTRSRHVKISIFRFRCPDCRYVHSVIPAFLEPYQPIALDLQEELVDAVQQGNTVGEVAEASESLSGGGLDERTIARLVRAWDERLAQLESGLWIRLLAWTPHLPLACTPSLWTVLRHAWHTVREWIPAFQDIQFLHGLNRLCFSMTVTGHG